MGERLVVDATLKWTLLGLVLHSSFVVTQYLMTVDHRFTTNVSDEGLAYILVYFLLVSWPILGCMLQIHIQLSRSWCILSFYRIK